MNDSIQILNKNGDMMSVEGIAQVLLTATNKKYLFYTLNEKVDNDLTKIYIAETSDVQGSATPINDDEWNDIRKKMVKISHKEELPDVTYMPFGDGTINVGEAKKLAVTSVAKQAFKDAQATHTVSTNQTDTPVVTGQSSFFADTGASVADNQANETQSIFANPPIPETSTTEVIQSAPGEGSLAVQPSVVESSTVGTEVASAENIPNTVVPEVISTPESSSAPTEALETPQPVPTLMPEGIAPTAVQPEMTGDTQVPQAPVPEVQAITDTPVEAMNPVGENIVTQVAQQPASPSTEATIQETIPQQLDVSIDSSVQPAEVVENPSGVGEIQVTNEQKEIISDEDALKAIEVIQDYIAQEEAA